MFIQDSESRIMSRSPFGYVYLAVDEPKGDPSSGRGGTQLAETDLHVRSYGERHLRSYADRWAGSGLLPSRAAIRATDTAKGACRNTERSQTPTSSSRCRKSPSKTRTVPGSAHCTGGSRCSSLTKA